MSLFRIELKYRREIDGLRAIAVLPVVLFHAGFSYFKGGYVGVDVFFVISGYLITSIILVETRSGSFSLLGFYERRARRILPALFLVSLVCIPFAWSRMLPRDLVDFSNSLMAVPAFMSNIYFWKQSGYFDTANELKPLLHTWSLAVEEQYYLCFPIFLLIALRSGRRWTVGLLAGAALVSFVFAQWGSLHASKAAFYLLPTRVWELMIGALIPFIPQRFALPREVVFGQALSIGGLVLIAYAVFQFGDVPYPGVYALAPTIGAALIILSANQQTLVGRLLGSRIFVRLGLISYSVYLWHQPLFVFARLSTVHEPSTTMLLALSGVAVGLSFLSWRYVELPFRSRNRIGRKNVFLFGSLGSVCLIAFGLIGALTSGFENSFYTRQLNQREQHIYSLIKKHTGGDMYLDMGDDGACNFWAQTVDDRFEARFKTCALKYNSALVVLGDSHAMSIYNALFRAQFDKFVVGVSQGGCRPHDQTSRCHYEGFNKFLARNRSSVRLVLFHQSGSYLMRDYKGVPDSSEAFDYGRRRTIDYDNIRKIAQYLDRLSVVAKVFWLGPFVEARVDFRDLRRLATSGLRMNPVAMAAFERLDTALESTVTEKFKFEFIPLDKALDIGPSFLLVGDCVTYRDRDHFSICGEKIIGERLKPLLRNYQAATR